jgi:hypothetical protein
MHSQPGAERSDENDCSIQEGGQYFYVAEW